MIACASERIEFARPARLPGVEVLLGEHSSRRWRWYHETYSVCTIIGGLGAVEWDYRRRHHCAIAGHVQLYEPGDAHTNSNVLVDANFRVLFISPAVVSEAAEDLGISPDPHWRTFHTGDAVLFRCLARFHKSLESNAQRLEVESRYADCLGCLLGHFTETRVAKSRPTNRAALLRVRDLISANYSREITLADLCGASRLSRFHLAHAFTTEFGLPPHAYQIQLRIRKAQHLLAAGHQPAMVAAETGFSDQSHFTRHFNRINGITPSRYSRMVRTPRSSRLGEAQA